MALSADGIKISDVRLINPPPSWKDDKLEIEIKYGNETTNDTQSAVGKRDKDNKFMIWNEPFILAGDIADDTRLTFTVQKKRVLKNTTFGSCECQAIDLLKQQGDSGLCKLDVVGECQLTFNIEKISKLDVVSGAIEKASIRLGNLSISKAPAGVANAINSVAEVYNDNEETWMSFLETFQTFMKVMDSVSEVNIYVQVAWSVLSIIPKTIIAKKNRDDKVRQLCEKLKDVYEYIMDAERLWQLTATQSTDSLRPTTRWSTMISTLCQQTIECARFIRAYGTENTAKNIVKAIGGSVDAKIQAFNDKLDHLMKVMTDSATLETGIITLRVSEKIVEQVELTLLGEIPYDSRAGYFPDKECLPGTRQRLISEIFEWANNDSSTQIFVLSGPAGIGKSAIAHTIAKMFQKQNRLGSMFCFNRSYADRCNRLFSTISRDLADGDIVWRKELVNVISNNSAVRKKEDVKTQFDELIIKPSKNVATIGPVIIVVDALDESGDRNERKNILNILLKRWTELPKNYRLIVTTRPEQDIELQCQDANVQCIRMGGIDAKETLSDIQAYVTHCLAPISSTLDEISRDWSSILAERAGGFFQWAQTVCQFIDPNIRHPRIIKNRWKTCISSSSLSLYGLYRQIISNQSEAKDDDFVEDFKTIVGAIITAREPLSINALQNIFVDIEDIDSLLAPFGSFFVGVHDLSTPVRPVHTSLFDFFISKNSAEEYYIDTSDQSLMTLGCLNVMDRMLCFNICQFETSHVRNEEVFNFKARVEKAIPLHLSYSCRFWSFHLQSSAHSEELVREIRRLMDDNLLCYFEALSLLGAVERGRVTMREIENWCKVDADRGLAEDAMDAWWFGVDFGDAMEESTPHVYLSALAFTPRDSFVSRKYLSRYPGLLTFDIGQPVGSSRKTGFTYKNPYMGFAFSPNGRYYAAGSRSTLYVWNYVTGENEVIHEDNRIGKKCSIVFSSDDESVYYCGWNGNILALEMGTKETSVESYREIAGADCEFCTISSDGCFIILVIDKETLLCDRKRRRVVKRFQGWYSNPAISPNGDWVALFRHAISPKGDWLGDYHRHSAKQLYIWNTRKQTQHVVPCDLRVHENVVVPPHFPEKLALSDSYVAFQINATTLEIWDVRTNTKVIQIRHKKRIFDFCLSPDDRYILVISYGMFSIQRVSTGELISRSYKDNLIRCLGFSYDSKSVALSPNNGSLAVQQWDESIEQSHTDSEDVDPIWLRGSYLILRYNIHKEYHLQISDITTTNTIIFETELEGDFGPVSVFPDEENVRVAYVSSNGLCLWDGKEGEIIVDGSVRSIIALVCSGSYLIYGQKNTITIWDSCTRKLVRGPIDLPYELKSLLSVRSTKFIVIYGGKAEVWDCESGDRLGETFTFKSEYRYSIVSANGEHFIFMSKNGVDILDLTGARVSSIPFPYRNSDRQLSLDGRYMSWIDDGEIKLFDMDTETLLTVPSLDRPVWRVWLSDDSKRIMIAYGGDFWEPEFLDIWDIQSKHMIIKAIPCQSPGVTGHLILNKRRLVVSVDQCYVWDLDTYEVISALYNNTPLVASGIEGTLMPFKTETLDYALMAWKKASLPSFAKMHQGWVLGLQGELLFWVPPKMRKQLWLPCVMHMPYRNILKPNFTNFVHGSGWTKCECGNC